MDDEELGIRFTYHPPKGDQPARYVALREDAFVFAKNVIAATPNCREQSLAITAIEEAVFWAIAAIARREA